MENIMLFGVDAALRPPKHVNLVQTGLLRLCRQSCTQYVREVCCEITRGLPPFNERVVVGPRLKSLLQLGTIDRPGLQSA